MRVIAIRDDGVEVFDDADVLQGEGPGWIEIDGEGNIHGHMFIVFRE